MTQPQQKAGAMPDQMALIERVLELTEAIRHTAQMSDWQGAARLVSERHPLLMSIQRDQPPQALALIRRIQTMNDAFAQEAATARDELTAEYRAAQRQASSAQAYLRGARL
jgi:flagellar protein FliT